MIARDMKCIRSGVQESNTCHTTEEHSRRNTPPGMLFTRDSIRV